MPVPRIFWLLLCSSCLVSCLKDEGGKNIVVSGYVVDGRTGKPIPDFPVDLYQEHHAPFSMGGESISRATRTDKRGYYTYDFWTEDYTNYGILAGSDSEATGVLRYDLPEGEHTKRNLEAAPTTWLSLTLHNINTRFPNGWSCEIQPPINIKSPFPGIFFLWELRKNYSSREYYDWKPLEVQLVRNRQYKLRFIGHLPDKPFDSLIVHHFHTPDTRACSLTLNF